MLRHESNGNDGKFTFNSVAQCAMPGVLLSPLTNNWLFYISDILLHNVECCTWHVSTDKATLFVSLYCGNSMQTIFRSFLVHFFLLFFALRFCAFFICFFTTYIRRCIRILCLGFHVYLSFQDFPFIYIAIFAQHSFSWSNACSCRLQDENINIMIKWIKN